jgi:outer membrane protein assembly factor BamB
MNMNRRSRKGPTIVRGLLILALFSTALTGCQNKAASGTVNSAFVDINGMLAAPTGIATSYATEEKLNLGNPNCIGVPQFLDGTLYTFSHDAHYEYVQLTSWDPVMGKHHWSVSTNQSLYVAPLVSDGKHLFALEHSTVVCLDKATGATIWKNPPEAASPFPFLALSGLSMHINSQSHTADRLYVLGEEVRYVSGATIEEKGQQGIWVLDATTGKSMGRIDWPVLTLSGNSGQLLCDGETLYASIPEFVEAETASAGSKYPVQKSSLAAFDLNTNKMLWKESVDGEGIGLVKQGSKLVFIRSAAYADDWIDVWEIGASSHSAKRLWTRRTGTTPEKWPITSFAVDSTHVYLQDSNAVLMALGLAAGTEVWRHPFASYKAGQVDGPDYGKLFDLHPDMILTTTRNVLYVQDGGGLVVALDPVTGKELWNKRISQVVWWQPGVGTGGLFVLQLVDKGFFVVASDGKVDLWK